MSNEQPVVNDVGDDVARRILVAGIKAAFPDKSPPIWSGAFVNVVVNY